MATKYPAPAPPYIPARHKGDRVNRPIDRIVVHGTTGKNSTRNGYARIIARYFQTTDRAASAHYAVDPGEVIQCVYDSWVAYHAPPNRGSLGVEMCDQVVGSIRRWRDLAHKRMLRRTARLVAELCLHFDIPPVFLGPRALRAGRKGITTHNNVSKTWRQTSHWDPGEWPRRRFMRMVREEIADIKGETLPPTRMTKAKVALEEALDLLEAVSVSRLRVHRIRKELEAKVAELPDR